MTQHQHPRLDAFVSLAWYDTLLRFITNFIAKTSELLLAAGLVVSSANFLTDGAILGTTTAASQAWAWAQALAIDSSLAISFYHVLLCVKQRDWVKCILYSLLTALLALVAGTLTNIDIFSHAMHVPINHAVSLMGLNVEMLSSLRSIAVVGFVLMSRLRDVSFKDFAASELETHPSKDEPGESHQRNQETQLQERSQGTGSPHFTIEDVALLVQVLARSDGALRTHITMEPDTAQADRASIGGASPPHQLDQTRAQSGATTMDRTPGQTTPPVSDPPHQEHLSEPSMAPDPVLAPQHHSTVTPDPSVEQPGQIQQEPDPISTRQRHHVIEPDPTDPDTVQKSREERLTLAYQELRAQGHHKISGRILAERAHMHRSFCTEWLRTHQQTPSASETNAIPQAEPGIEDSEQEDQEEEPL
ncbi:hypothetical protein [Dictyobacter arantiisoli]|uniref:DUF2637 domain-containing protein n=1 Tax=Dictyobacter arantiisoli TaxID=2014874 RepID=A0A5A5TKK7_9CHLR|nr:hypothetical protein [Dictyobacter arantiisoli]GCF11812.1 hypothetical protein KDI_53760 [Dictyobacter arantiisoli]